MLSRPGRLPALVLFPAVLLLYVFRIDRVVGLIVDDAWYVMLAEALARGDGYRLVNAPFTEHVLPMYPPGFPALLSLIFRVRPEFPSNLWLLKSVSIAAMMGAGVVSYVYFSRYRSLPRELAICASLAFVMTPVFVFLATSTVMSECVFTLTQLGTVLAAHRLVEAGPAHERRWTIAAGVLAAASMLIRSTGIGVVLAVLAYFLTRRRLRQSGVFLAIVVVCVLPWLTYTAVHAPTKEQQLFHRGAIMYSYGEQFWMRWAGSASSGRIGAGELPQRIAGNLVDVFGRGIGGLVAPLLIRGPEESGEELIAIGGTVGWTFVGLGNTPANMAISIVLAAIVALGFIRTARRGMTPAEWLVPISLAITLLWPWWSFRFLVPLTPFLFLYLINGISTPAMQSPARILLLTMLSLQVYEHAAYIQLKRSHSPKLDWIAQFDEADAMMTWMRHHLDADATIATTNPPLVYLRTRRKTVTLDTLVEPRDAWNARGVRYIAPLMPYELPRERFGKHQVLYVSPSPLPLRNWVVELE